MTGSCPAATQAFHYHRASASIAHWISRLAKTVRLSGPTFAAAVKMSAEEIAALSAAADEVDVLHVSKPNLPMEPRSHATSSPGRPCRRSTPHCRCSRSGHRHWRRSPRRPRPPPSGSGVIGRSSASTSQEPADRGDAEARVSSLGASRLPDRTLPPRPEQQSHASRLGGITILQCSAREIDR